MPAGAGISFATIEADAARVTLDGTDRGWIWSPDWSVPLPCDLAESEHRLSLELVPGTYNRFGPHQHIDGDRHVVSPDQFAGRKNFADRAEAPESTHDSDWRFPPFSRREWSHIAIAFMRRPYQTIHDAPLFMMPCKIK